MDTFQSDMSALKNGYPLNIRSMSVIPETSHEFIRGTQSSPVRPMELVMHKFTAFCRSTLLVYSLGGGDGGDGGGGADGGGADGGQAVYTMSVCLHLYDPVNTLNGVYKHGDTYTSAVTLVMYAPLQDVSLALVYTAVGT